MGESSNASVLAKVALGLAAAAVLFDIIGISTPYWTALDLPRTTISNGLFKLCSGGSCIAIDEILMTDELKATTAMSLLGLLTGIACLVLTVCHVFVLSMGTKVVKTVCMVLAFVAAAFSMIAVIIYGTKYDQNQGWSLALVIIGGLLYLVTGIVLVIDVAKG